MKAHPALFEREGKGEGQKKMRKTFQRFRPEEFSSGDFGLKSFCQLAILTWAEISDISGQKLCIFQRGVEGGGKGEGVNGFKYCLVKVKWRSSRGTCAVCHPEILFLNKRAEHIDFR